MCVSQGVTEAERDEGVERWELDYPAGGRERRLPRTLRARNGIGLGGRRDKEPTGLV